VRFVDPDFAVIFDADGVILDSERQSFEALRVAVECVSAGRYRLTEADFPFVSGRDDDSIVVALNQIHGLGLDADEFRRVKLDCYHRILETDPVRIAPGVHRLLDELSAAAVPYAIATSAIRAKLELSLASVGLRDRFPIITSADDVRAAKPEPDLFLLTATRLGASPARTVVFEDTVNGVLAANRAGMFAVGVAGTFPRAQLAMAKQIIDSLEEVNLTVLRQWIDSRHS